MARKPHHDTLEERIRQLEEEVANLKRAEQTLQTQKAYLEHIFDSAPEAIALADKDHRITRTNAQFTHLFGYSPEEAMGRLCDDLIAPPERYNEASDITLKVGHGETIRLETVRFRKHESPVFVELMAAPVRSGDEHIGDYVTYRDVTERKQAEEALRRERDLLRLLTETSPVGITVVDRTGQISFANQRAEEVFGLTKDQIRQRTYNASAWHITDYDGNPFPDEELPFRQVITTGKPVYGVCHAIERPDGRRVLLSVNAAPLFNDAGELDGMVANVENVTERKRAEEALRVSEERFRKVFEEGPIGMVLTNRDLKFFSANPAFCRMLGYTVEEMGSRTFLDVTHPEYRDADKEYVDKMWGGEIPHYRTQKRYLTKNGKVRWGSLSASLIRGRDGQPLYALAMVEDISDRRRAEEEKEKFQAQLANAVEMARLGPWEYDVSSDLFTFNDHFYKIFKTTVKQVGGYIMSSAEYARRFVHPDDIAVVAEEIRKAMEATDPDFSRKLEHRMLYVDGTVGHISVRFFIVKDTHGQTIKTYGVNQDITDRKRAEEALRASEMRFREMADLLPQTVYETDHQGMLTYVNRHALDLFGYTEEDFEKGLVVFQMLIPEDRDRTADAFRAVLKGNPPGIDREYGALRKDGTSFPVEIYSSPIVHDGTTVGLRGILVDMSEHQEAEVEKDKLRAQLNQAQKMESVGRLAGGVAHDFNNMLGVIIGNAEMAMMEMAPAEHSFKNIEEILKASRRSAELVRQLLAFARKQTVIPKVLDLNETVSGMLKMLRRLIGEDIDLAWMPGHDLWHVKIDPSQIDQILANLTVNAKDAIPGVGKITIETDNTTLDEAYCADHLGFEPGQYVLLAVSDNGIGMSKEILEHLFEPFFTTKELGKGTGLGLSSVYGVVKQNGGFSNVYSEIGEGTTFEIYLPRFEVKDAAMQVGVQPEPLQEGTETVLIVEDEAPILETGKAMLERLGYNVLTAGTPHEAIRLAGKSEEAIHLLFTDVVMPGMNGKELEGQIKAIHPRLKCLYMSGYTANVIAHHGVLDEGVHFIHKPFTMKELAAKVREALGKS